MAKYYYNPFPSHSDSKLKKTRKRYTEGRRVEVLASSWDPSSNLPTGLGPAFQHIFPGDVIYVNAHGKSDHANSICAKHKLRGMSTRMIDLDSAQLANQMVNHDGLPDGRKSPIYLKCLMCYAGGLELTPEALHYPSARQGLADGRFAQLLAQALGNLGHTKVRVGGYPGEINARPRNVGSVCWNRSGPFPSQSFEKVTGMAVWFDTTGRAVNKDEGND